ncbi:MAG: SWF/SNF helicase family protein, partial [Planctomycetes bacterium]|nr:SWF/SNF helicase family protein [Planctomycetota bacterium]
DPACRVFLAGDVAATGLNLQHAASAVLNVDLPWNPAVLEQRIGRVHRIGQRKPVRVVNLVAEDSIEHRILGLLGTKRSLASGILDGGQDTVDLGGDRMKRFMSEVEQASGTTPAQSAATTATPLPLESSGLVASDQRRPIPARRQQVATPAAIAARLAALVGGMAADLQVTIGTDGKATVTLSADLLERFCAGKDAAASAV